METLELVLKEQPFFHDFPAQHLELIVGCASNVRFEAGKVIFREGEAANKFYLIRHGKVALEMVSERRGPVTVLTVGEGEILGWSWLFPPHFYKFTARTMDPVRALAIDGQCLRGKAEEDHDLGYHLLKRWAPLVERALDATRLQLINVYQDK